jgi:ATP-binding protein involved in chromosome partitioning
MVEEKVLQALGAVIEPDLRRDLVSLNMIRALKVEGGRVAFSILLTTPACPPQGTDRARGARSGADRPRR